MTYQSLKDFIQRKMRMQHIYQPVFIKTLLESDRPVSVRNIAKQFAAHDESQIEYYEYITRSMPAKVLKRHGIVREVPGGYELGLEGNRLTKEQCKELIQLCESKLEEYKEKRGRDIWMHRRKGTDPVPGSMRFRVLMRAGFRCELCGIPADKRALEVDHIIPRNRKGTNDEANLQALCYTCNAQKRDLDQTDFREWKTIYERRDPSCTFCRPEKRFVLDETTLAYGLRDKYPVTEGHFLIVPKRHIASVFGLYGPELNACIALLKRAQERVLSKDPTVHAFNIGVNDGTQAGQTIPHCHWHLIPRRDGDAEDPTGGIRNVIPGKGRYG